MLKDKEERYYYGFIGGEEGNYFEGDYFEIVTNSDNKFTWKDSEIDYITDNRSFNTKKEAKEDFINTMLPDDGSKIIINKDPDKLYDKINK